VKIKLQQENNTIATSTKCTVCNFRNRAIATPIKLVTKKTANATKKGLILDKVATHVIQILATYKKNRIQFSQ
jgi:hypothetical protein